MAEHRNRRLVALAACTTRMPGESYAGPMPERAPERAERLMADVQMLAEEIGERNMGNPEALGLAADHVEARR